MTGTHLERADHTPTHSHGHVLVSHDDHVDDLHDLHRQTSHEVRWDGHCARVETQW